MMHFSLMTNSTERGEEKTGGSITTFLTKNITLHKPGRKCNILFQA